MKPKNLAMGRGNRSSLLYMFDFGLAKLFINPATGEHIPFRTGLILVGASRYVSHNVHFGRGMFSRTRLFFSFSNVGRDS